jgi:hypothetical protein
MEPVEIVLRRRRAMRRDDEGVNLTKVQCKDRRKCHTDMPPYNKYMLRKMF